jgi:6-pyruvoyl-tetrahydropterin synthase
VKIHLILKQTLLASHSLSVREEPHPHIFKFEVDFTGEPKNGMIVNLPELEMGLGEIFKPFQSRYLNDCSLLPEEAQKFPTCETLGVAFAQKIENTLIPKFSQENPTLKLVSVLVTLCEPDGREYGSARIVI